MLILAFIILALLIRNSFGLKVIPETLKVSYVNDKYVKNVVANVRRYSRNSPYYFNIHSELQHNWANNITIDIVVTEFLHNEYRRSFIEFHYKLCDLINKEPYIGAAIRSNGVKCPILKGRQGVYNYTTNTDGFPNVFPFEKGGANVDITITDTGERIASGHVHLRFVQKRSRT